MAADRSDRVLSPLGVEIARVPPPPDVAEAPADATETDNVRSKVLAPGTGHSRPLDDDVVEVHYTMWTKDGATVDDSRSRGTPATWIVRRISPAGLASGIRAMVEGEKRRLWISPYFSSEWTHQALTVDVELLRVTSPKPAPPTDRQLVTPPPDTARTSSGLRYHVHRAGTGTEHPRPTSTVTIHYTAWSAQPSTIFDDTVARGAPATVAVDEVMAGLSEALQRMVVGERTRFWIPAELAYAPPGPPQTALVFDVELVGIQRAVEGSPGTVRVQVNTPDAAYTLIEPDGTPRTAKGPRTFAGLPPGNYRIKPADIRSYAAGVVSRPADLSLAPGGTVEITITYRAIVR